MPFQLDGIRLEERRVRWLYEPGSLTPAARVERGKLHYTISDHQGTVREIFDEQGERIWSQRLGTWSEAEITPAPSHYPDHHVDCNFRFMGQYFDEETQLHYNRHRYFSPETGQYISADPIGLAGGFNPYGYVHNPANFVDPFGLAGEDCDKLLKQASKKTVPPINEAHVFHGEINKKGKAVGFHYEGLHQGKARIVEITNPPNAQGVYRGRVEIFNPKTNEWQPKVAKSTFYPKSWSPQQVTAEIKGAFQNGAVDPSGKWTGVSPDGVKIEGWLDASGKINTAYPLY